MLLLEAPHMGAKAEDPQAPREAPTDWRPNKRFHTPAARRRRAEQLAKLRGGAHRGIH